VNKTMSADIPVLAPADGAAPAQGKSKRKLLIIIAAATLAVVVAAGAAFWLHSGSKGGAAEKKAVVIAPPVYLALDPPFVVNFDSDQTSRFLQIAVQLMSRDPATIELLKANDPVVRNNLLLLFGNQKYSELSTRAGKEALRGQALASVREVIGAAGGHAEKLEAVYFTSFVMQ
jgi:flagellar protein FliL